MGHNIGSFWVSDGRALEREREDKYARQAAVRQLVGVLRHRRAISI